jgi:hypothetical protein
MQQFGSAAQASTAPPCSLPWFGPATRGPMHVDDDDITMSHDCWLVHDPGRSDKLAAFRFSRRI